MVNQGIYLVVAVGLFLCACSDDNDKASEQQKFESYVEEQALALLSEMTLQEKVDQMSGGRHSGETISIMTQVYNSRLGIPSNVYNDGPRGARSNTSSILNTTAFPIESLRASSFNTDREFRIGEICGNETRALGNYVMLSPCINQVINPRWGRAQDSYGEDTFLLGAMGAAFAKGIQYAGALDADGNMEPDTDGNGMPIFYDSRGRRSYRVQSMIKHMAMSNVENSKRDFNAVVDERTLREVFLPHFKKCIDKAEPSSVMSEYNMINGVYCSENSHLLRDILYGEWGFDGYVVSDWYARAYSAADAVYAGLSVEMPYSDGVPGYEYHIYGSRLYNLVAAGEIAEVDIDRIVLRILKKKIAFGMLDYGRDFTKEVASHEDMAAYREPSAIETEEHVNEALVSAREGIVLLKDGDRTTSSAGSAANLPLNPSVVTGNSPMVLIGRYANGHAISGLAHMGDAGSSNCVPSDSVNIYRGMLEYLGGDIDRVRYFTGKTDSDAGGDFLPVGHSEYPDVEALTALKSASIAVCVTGFVPAALMYDPMQEEGEDHDRDSSVLPERDYGNIQTAIEVKTNTGSEYYNPELKIIVLIQSGSSVIVDPWFEDVDVIVQTWYAGMCGGQAAAELLFGMTMDRNIITDEALQPGPISFSGKTCLTFHRSEQQLPYYPEKREPLALEYNYYHGYRYFEKNLSKTEEKKPRYWFGYGLSYNTYRYSNLSIDNRYKDERGRPLIKVTLNVTNEGLYDSEEIVQAYVGFENTLVNDRWGRPVKQLFAFSRVHAGAGETVFAEMFIDPENLKYWNPETGNMELEDIEYNLYVAGSADPEETGLEEGFHID